MITYRKVGELEIRGEFQAGAPAGRVVPLLPSHVVVCDPPILVHLIVSPTNTFMLAGVNEKFCTVTFIVVENDVPVSIVKNNAIRTG